MEELIFLLLAAGTLAGAAFVAFSRNIVHSAFALLLSFFSIAGFYVFLSADFLAAAQVVVYIGGILVLILFGVMLTEKIEKVNISNSVMKPVRAILLLAAVFTLLAYAILHSHWPAHQPPPPSPQTAVLGDTLLGKHLLPFEVASVLLLAALIGAIIAGRKEVKDK